MYRTLPGGGKTNCCVSVALFGLAGLSVCLFIHVFLYAFMPCGACVCVCVCVHVHLHVLATAHTPLAGRALSWARQHGTGPYLAGAGGKVGGQGSKLACLHVCLPAMHVHAHATTRHLAWLACLYVCPIALACMCAHARHDLHAHAHDKHNHTNTAEQNSSESLVFVQRPCRTRALPLSLPRMRWKGKRAVESEKHVGKGKWERGREVREWS